MQFRLVCPAVFLLVLTIAHAGTPARQGKAQRLPLDGIPHIQLKTRENSHFLPDRVIVKLTPRTFSSLSKSSFGISSLDRMLSNIGVESVSRMFPQPAGKGGSVDLSLFHVVQFSSPHDVFTLAEELTRGPDVEYAEPWFIYPLAGGTFLPNDPFYQQQWHLPKIKAAEAWDITQGDSTIVVAIVDSGTEWTHPDLAPNIWTNPGESGTDAQGNNKRTNSIDDDNNGFVDDWHGWDLAGAHYQLPILIPDNNPTSTGTNNEHGTHVAGIAAAATNNGTGVASIGFRTHILPVKCSADDDNRAGGTAFILTGYQGIVYAADMGAHVINCSWGGAGGSQFEQDVIDYATEQGSLVVGAAGNSGSDVFFSPAGYRNVLGVASTGQSDFKSFFSNYGYWLDVSAPGENILSTLHGSKYNNTTDWSGTSMASPLVAGLAALVKKQLPQLSMLQVGEQVRVTCDNIESQNPGFPNQLGKGRINAFRALTETTLPAVRLLSFHVKDSPGGNNNGFAQPAETLNVVCTFRNFLSTTSPGATVELIPLSPYLTVVQGSFPIPALGTLDSVSNMNLPFRVFVRQDVPQSHTAHMEVRISDAQYTDRHTFSFLVNPTYQTHDLNEIQLTLTNNGRIGFFDFPDNTLGNGFVFNGVNQLFEGGLILGTSGSKLVDVVRNESGGQDNDFTSNDFYDISTPGTVAHQEGFTRFSDANVFGPEKIGINVEMHSYAFSSPGDTRYIILHYDLKNPGGTVISNLYTGIFLDWDIGIYEVNVSAFDATRSLGYAFDNSRSERAYLGIRALDSAASYRTLINDGTLDLSRFAKWFWISGGIFGNPSSPSDIHHMIASGPYVLGPGGTQKVAFALVAAESSLTQLQEAADAAKAKWLQILNPVSVEETDPTIPLTFGLEQNFPNPFNPSTTIGFRVAREEFVRITVFDMLGRQVATLVDEMKTRGLYQVRWDARSLSSGIYHYRLRAGTFVETRKLVLMR